MKFIQYYGIHEAEKFVFETKRIYLLVKSNIMGLVNMVAKIHVASDEISVDIYKLRCGAYILSIVDQLMTAISKINCTI